MFFWVAHTVQSFSLILLTYRMDIALLIKYQYYMKTDLRTFIKHTAKDFHNQSVNPPVVRASTIIFKNLIVEFLPILQKEFQKIYYTDIECIIVIALPKN